MNIKHLVYRSIILFLLISLSCNSQSGNTQHQPGASGEAILIFIDISRSVPNEAFESALKRLEKLYSDLPNERCIIIVYPLFGKTGQFTPPMAEIGLERNPYSGNVEMQSIFEKNKHDRWINAKETIQQKRLEYYTQFNGGGPLNYSCILKSLSDAKQFFVRNNFRRKRMIYLSDMLEDCDRTGIDFDKSAQDFVNAKDLAFQQITPDSFLKDVEISILIPVTPNFPEWIDNDNLVNFWRVVFARVGMNGDMKIDYEIIAEK